MEMLYFIHFLFSNKNRTLFTFSIVYIGRLLNNGDSFIARESQCYNEARACLPGFLYMRRRAAFQKKFFFYNKLNENIAIKLTAFNP